MKIKVINMASDAKPWIEEKVGESQPRPDSMAECRTTLALEGMTCASCAMRIEKGLRRVPGVKEASVNLASERASVTYDPAQTNVEQMVRSVEAVGYKATPQIASSQEAMPVEDAGSVSGALVIP